jgi:hypothetical protein
MEINRNTMTVWVIEALQELGGSDKLINILKKVWEKHGEEITASGDMFYTWQYEIRWAGDTCSKATARNLEVNLIISSAAYIQAFSVCFSSQEELKRIFSQDFQIAKR